MIGFQNGQHARSPLVWDFITAPSDDDMIPEPSRNQAPLSLLDCLSPSDHQTISRPIALTKRVRRKTPLPIPLFLWQLLGDAFQNIHQRFRIFFDFLPVGGTNQWSTWRKPAPSPDSAHSFSCPESRYVLVSLFFLRLLRTNAQN